MLFSIVTQVSRVVVAIVLARLLTPADYGLAAIAFVCTTFVLTLSDASLGKALVQQATIDELDRSTVFWATLGIGVLLTGGGVAVSGPLAHLFHQPKAQPLIAVLSISFILVSLQMTQASLFQRSMMFKATTVRLILSVAVGGAVGIGTALMGGGAWALIAQQLAVGATSAFLLWVLSPWRPKLMFSWSRLRSLGGFGFRVMGARLMDDVSSNADNALIGRFLGSAALGAYSVAYNLMTVPVVRLVLPIQETLFPAYARIQDDVSRVRQIWLRTTVVVTSVVAPAMVGLVVVAPDFIHVVLGSRWAATGPVVRILAPLAIAQSLAALASTTLLARGRAKTVFRFSVVNTILVVGAFVFGLQWGIIGVAAAFACVSIPMAGVLLYLAARALEGPVAELARALGGPLEATGAMAVAGLGAQWFLQSESISVGIRLPLVIAVAALVYVPACILRVGPVRSELRRFWRGRALASIAEPARSADAD
jgi:O-antigen/teichoic acid export membrane protein